MRVNIIIIMKTEYDTKVEYVEVQLVMYGMFLFTHPWCGCFGNCFVHHILFDLYAFIISVVQCTV